MANLLHIKGSRNKVLNQLPNNSFGSDGDIVVCNIKGKGIYLCIKSNGTWFASNQLKQLKKLEKTSIDNLKVNQLKAKNTTLTQNELDVPTGDLTLDVAGSIDLTSSTEVKSDTPLKIKESANAIADTAAYGQLWVKTATPNELYFTTDAGDDIQLTSGTATAFVGDITGVTAGDGLTGGGNSGDVSLAVGVDDSTIEIDSDALRVKDDGITYSKIQNVTATDRILGRDSSGAGVIEEITPANLRTMINVADGATSISSLNDLSDVTYSSGDLTITSLDKIVSGNLEFDSSGNITIDTDGHTEFNSPAGFDQFTPTYNASDTEVNFKTDGNKAFVTFGSGNITDLNLNLPATSGNFVLLLKQDGTGSRTVTNYKAFDSSGSAANGSATVKFAGGSNPTLTTDANHVDILSFYWDADNEICYGVASLDFQF
jgi:hypothetical protein